MSIIPYLHFWYKLILGYDQNAKGLNKLVLAPWLQNKQDDVKWGKNKTQTEILTE